VLHSWEVLASILSSDKTLGILCDIGMYVGGVCSALVLSRALSSRGEARSNLLMSSLKRVLRATAHHVMLPDACYLPANCLLTAWPATPVPTLCCFLSPLPG
jgi:hypothetical protein